MILRPNYPPPQAQRTRGKIAHEESKKDMARKGAETQRNKEGPHKDAKPACGRLGAKKKPFAAWRLCAQKIKCLEKEKFKLDFTP